MPMAARASQHRSERVRAEAVVAAFSGEAERFVLRAFRLFRRSLTQREGDAGKILAKHLRARVPPDAFERILADLTALMLEIYFAKGQPTLAPRAAAKQSTKEEFFFIALLEATQRRDAARAAEAAMALLDTFRVSKVLDAAGDFVGRLRELDFWLMPIADTAFNYFADYRPLDEKPTSRPGRSSALCLQVVHRSGG